MLSPCCFRCHFEACSPPIQALQSSRGNIRLCLHLGVSGLLSPCRLERSSHLLYCFLELSGDHVLFLLCSLDLLAFSLVVKLALELSDFLSQLVYCLDIFGNVAVDIERVFGHLGLDVLGSVGVFQCVVSFLVVLA